MYKPASPKLNLKLLLIVFFLSGAAGLIYEIVWGRLLVLVFGSNTNSIVATLSAFLGGLAIGSFIFGRKADTLPAKRLLPIYSLLEMGIGISALATLVIIPLLKHIYGLF